MDTALLKKKFELMGARLKTGPFMLTRRRPASAFSRPFTIDIAKDRNGEFFDVKVNENRSIAIDALDVIKADRHLLLMVKTQDADGHPEKQKFLCGHDERSWFVAAIPESAGASNVKTAMEALKPMAVRASQEANRVRDRHRNRRKNRGFVRQGEWFFVPLPDMKVDPQYILRNEPMQRSGGKAHWAELAFRSGGEAVYVSRLYPNGVNGREYQALMRDEPSLRGTFRSMLRNATLFVKGRISHPDHKTITLNGWHRVEMNTEGQSKAMQNVVFLD